MNSAFRPSSLALIIGDLACFVLALWVALFLRSFAVPAADVILDHLAAFAPLFVVWILVYTIAGLYEGRRIVFARRALLATLLYAQLANVILAALFFFAVPFFGIAPKTILFIYLFISFFFLLAWRVFLFPRLGLQRKSPALIVGDNADIRELVEALRIAPLSPIAVADVIVVESGNITERLHEAIARLHPRYIIIDFSSPIFAGGREILPDLYNLLGRGVRFIDAHVLYEEVFGRVPLSQVDDAWIAHNVSRPVEVLYDPLKRLLDLCGALLLGLLSLVLYPFIMLAIFAESGAPIFIGQERVGGGDRIIRLYKFRTMTGNDNGIYQGGVSTLRVTKIGALLRATRLDELPQLWNVARGDLSLIGPRPEFPSLVAHYAREIPYYGLRHLIRPGLSGWAQLYHDNHPHHGAAVEATREKLSYDLYYLKYRSLALDVLVALKTVAKLLTRSGV